MTNPYSPGHYAMLMTGLSLFMLYGCNTTGPDYHGFNFLQDRNTAMDNAAACLSMQYLRLTGANSIILIPFLEQESAHSTVLSKSDSVTDQQLEAALQLAKNQRLHVVLKPQILVKDSWAGAIAMKSSEDESKWFQQYRKYLKHYAGLANKYAVDALVIGTELNGMQNSSQWPGLINDTRKIFSGSLTYAANGVQSAEQFTYWSLLDHIGVTLYPTPNSQAKSGLVASQSIQQLQQLSKTEGHSIWILEIGMPSAKGWEAHPWDWRKLERHNPEPDTDTQARLIDQWLTSSNKPWIDGIWLWQWNSSPDSGGDHDNGYTVQNKKAQLVIQDHWQADNLLPFDLHRRTSCG